MSAPRYALAACLIAILAAPSGAATWVVAQDGSGHFREIAEALASAAVQDGDGIMVQPGSYHGFQRRPDLAASTPFQVSPDYPDYLTIANIAAGKRAGISGALVEGDYAWVQVRDCAGEVLLEDVEVGGYGWRLSISSAANVAITGLRIEPSWPPSDTVPVSIANSQVRMSDAIVRGF